MKTAVKATSLSFVGGLGVVLAGFAFNGNSAEAADRDFRRDDHRGGRDVRHDDHREFERREAERREHERWEHRPEYRHTPVWIAPVYETRERQVWVPDVTEQRPTSVRDSCGRWVTVMQTVVVCPGHYQTVCEQVLVAPGHWS